MNIKIGIEEIIGKENSYIPIKLVTDKSGISYRFYRVENSDSGLI